MATRMLQRRGTAAEWAAQNPILGPGEIGFETDTKIIRVGDGETPWNTLSVPYIHASGGVMTGPLTVVAPTQTGHAARLADVNTRLPLAGGVLTGTLGLVAPTAPSHAARVTDLDQVSMRQLIKHLVNATFVKADYPWLRYIRARVQGGGGGGGGAGATIAGQASGGTGGNGGVYAESLLLASALAASVPITIGDGGTGGLGANNGSSGSTSSFGSHVSANGGTAGMGGSGTGGSSRQPNRDPDITGVGQIVVPSQRGEGTWIFGGEHYRYPSGGDSVYGSGGNGIANSNGQAGYGRGSGGGGAVNFASQGARNGGVGAPGLVILELYG